MRRDDITATVLAGAGRRVRPIVIMVATVAVGLVPIMFGTGTGTGTGAEVMQHIATPMIGGVASTLVLALLVIPAVYWLWRTRGMENWVARGSDGTGLLFQSQSTAPSTEPGSTLAQSPGPSSVTVNCKAQKSNKFL
ncbi:hypothetical protein FKG94_08865 [Exilibacterium tricleocarpae]|uniref:Efflux RND transporter permease subunit n=1 Tax=Exilibacterium tricleocarpae TaxID=2591008 RepID=A0A545TVF9_9GAMM|nr:efflux RND transporter permease subunit [Exilibacterium tricleocarpae]TQV81207.1 hypothetical protein FKG94_08865 [Exilibacterium tricleocarpae]